MKESTRQRKHDEKLAQLLGITVEEVRASREQEERDDKVLEAQAVSLFLEKPEAFIQKICKECGEHFLTTYQFVSECSSPCRSKALARIGIDWNPMHNQVERWARAQIPTGYTIPPKALQILLAIAQEQQQAQELADCATDEPHELSLYTEQSKNGSHIDLVESLPELNFPEFPDFSLE